MSAGPQPLKLTVLRRMIKAVLMEGLPVRGVTTNRDGMPVVLTNADESDEIAATADPFLARLKRETK